MAYLMHDDMLEWRILISDLNSRYIAIKRRFATGSFRPVQVLPKIKAHIGGSPFRSIEFNKYDVCRTFKFRQRHSDLTLYIQQFSFRHCHSRLSACQRQRPGQQQGTMTSVIGFGPVEPPDNFGCMSLGIPLAQLHK
ncbi:MAG: hypothetical protein VW989_08670 [Rhodobiaceae bacterium]